MPKTTSTNVTYHPVTGAYYEGLEPELRPGMHAVAEIQNPIYQVGDATGTLATSAANSRLPPPPNPTDPNWIPAPQKLRTMLLDEETRNMAEVIGLNKRAVLERTLTAAAFDVGRDNLDHLILIRLYNQLMGDQMRWFHLDNMFNEMSVDKLLLRMSFKDNPAMVQEVGPREQYDVTKVNYDEIPFLLTKKVTSYDIALEDPLRALISPTMPLQQSMDYAMAYYREREGLAALKKLTYHYNSTAAGKAKFNGKVVPPDAAKIPNLKTPGTTEFHSPRNPVNAIQVARNEFMELYDCMLTHFACGPLTAMLIAQNTWTQPNTINNVEAYRTNGGVRSFPGLSDATMVISQIVPENVLYAISKPMNILVKAEGPKVTRTWEDNSRFTTQTASLDFHQYKCAAENLTMDRRFGVILDIDITDAAGA